MLIILEIVEISAKVEPTPVLESFKLSIADWATLVDSTANLLWPILIFIILLIFKNQISDILSRLRKGKVLGQEIELHEDLKDLKEFTNEAVEELPIKIEKGELNKQTIGAYTFDSKSIPEETARNPTNALFHLGILIEQQIRDILASTGKIGDYLSGNIVSNVNSLVDKGLLPSSAAHAITYFIQIRGRIVHGREAQESEILSAIDSGMTILRLLEAVPRQTYIVYHPGVAVYSDPNCMDKRIGVKGVILETISAGGVKRSFYIYPTTKNYYIKGKRVSWEWNMKDIFRESWYRDPDTNEIKYGWTEAAEFVGRHIDDL